MTNKTLLCIAALSLSSIAFAKSYDVVLNSPAKIGATHLTAGEYKLKVDGSNAVFTDQKTRNSVTVPARIENAGKKFDATQVDTTKQGDMDEIKMIELGGSTTKLEFGQ